MAAIQFKNRHPRGLKGQEIGLWYKAQRKEQDSSGNRQDQQKQSNKIQFDARINLPQDFIDQIEYQLNAFEEGDKCRTINKDFENYFKETLNTSFEDFLKDHSQNLEISKPVSSSELSSNSSSASRFISEDQNKLPVFKYANEILKSIKENTFVLISGETGCGKTTQIPQIILDDQIEQGAVSKCNIVCTQPRRISAITVAERVAMERGERIGNSVGYQIRLENRMPRNVGSILYCTTGVLLRRMESDPLVLNVSHIILDEIHERNVETDLLIGLLQKVVKYNTKLKVLLMSATFGIEDFAKHFSNCSIIKIEGTLYPVKVKYLEDVLEEIKFFKFDNPRSILSSKPKHFRYMKAGKAEIQKNKDYEDFINPYARTLVGQYSNRVIETIQNPRTEDINVDLMASLIFHIDKNEDVGAVLVFLPSYEKISKLHDLLYKSYEYRSKKFLIYPLHSMMPTVEQKGVFQRPPQGVRKIILATNIAETSITIDDVVYVINSGKVKIKDYDMSKNFETLTECWVTQAHSKQRQGRAGRCQPGICYNLYTKAREYTLEVFPLPEIQRTRLEPVILNLKMLKIHKVKDFLQTLISVPHDTTLENGVNLLKRINALDENEFITPLGLHLARLPLDPQIGKMILIAALFQCIDPITSVAATLSYKDPFYRPIGKEDQVDRAKREFSDSSQSDHLTYANVIDKFRLHGNNRNFLYANFLAYSTLNQLEKMKLQLCELLESTGFINHSNPINSISNSNSNRDHLLRAVIAAGLYPNVAVVKKIRQIKNRAVPILNVETPEDGDKVSIHPSSVNSKERRFDSKFLVFFNKQKSSSIFLHETTMVYPISLIVFGDRISTGQVNGKHYISVANNTFRFESNENTTKIILKLRNRFDILLREMALNPSAINESTGCEKNLIDALVMLLAYEEGDSDYYDYKRRV